MNYEKKYKDALERAKEKYAMFEGMKQGDVLEDVFPELKESEDDSIRKAIHIYLDWLDGRKDYAPKGEYSIRDMIAWIEKQGKNNMGISESVKQKLEDNLSKALEKETPESWNEFLNEQKSAWSEEDEKMFNSALWHIKNSCGNQGKNSGEFEVYNWLKSFKNRYTWKPSDEQINALQTAIGIVGELTSTASLLKEIREQLKKLR